MPNQFSWSLLESIMSLFLFRGPQTFLIDEVIPAKSSSRKGMQSPEHPAHSLISPPCSLHVCPPFNQPSCSSEPLTQWKRSRKEQGPQAAAACSRENTSPKACVSFLIIHVCTSLDICVASLFIQMDSHHHSLEIDPFAVNGKP